MINDIQSDTDARFVMGVENLLGKKMGCNIKNTAPIELVFCSELWPKGAVLLPCKTSEATECTMCKTKMTNITHHTC
jgi:hypothetical protein